MDAPRLGLGKISCRRPARSYISDVLTRGLRVDGLGPQEGGPVHVDDEIVKLGEEVESDLAVVAAGAWAR